MTPVLYSLFLTGAYYFYMKEKPLEDERKETMLKQGIIYNNIYL